MPSKLKWNGSVILKPLDGTPLGLSRHTRRLSLTGVFFVEGSTGAGDEQKKGDPHAVDVRLTSL
ncbi:hypothetical protein ABU162_12920 [Paenibacillus thiaminolyticus]|uniref:hypothetical protein n=1 Tax=Paenibacillus thiaminolyticus TaxID=49283 RepID=UPI0035A5FCC7